MSTTVIPECTFFGRLDLVVKHITANIHDFKGRYVEGISKVRLVKLILTEIVEVSKEEVQ